MVKSRSAWPENKNPLQGIIPPLVTPLMICDDSSSSTTPEIDVESTKRIIEHVIEAGVSGIFILGTTGEWPSLSLKQRTSFCELCCRIVAGRIPVLVGITDPSLDTTINMADCASEAGAAAVVVTTPYYFPMDSSDVLNYFQNQLLPHIKLPIMLYNMPGLTNSRLDIESILKPLASMPQIVGIKDSSGDLEYFRKICRLKDEHRPDWTVLMGPEHLTVEAIRLGADGGVNGGANLEPKLFVGLCQAALEGNAYQVELLQKRVEALQKIYTVTDGFGFVAATKCAMAIQGLCQNVVASPMVAFSQTEGQHVETILKNLPTI